MAQPPSAAAPPQLQPVGPFPELTRHQHRLITLANGLAVLLVSVPEPKAEEGLASSLAASAQAHPGMSDVQRHSSTRLALDTLTASQQQQQQQQPQPPLQQQQQQRSLEEATAGGVSLRSHLGQTSRASLRQSYSGSIRSAASGASRFAARRASAQAYGYSLLEQSRRAEAQRKRVIMSRAAGCALSVAVGSFSDPPKVQGLAHLVEHVVFMGSDLFPVEGDWDRFVAVVGGESNASTEAERTTFHFTAPQDYFEDALERFARFFIKPLLRQSSIDREMSAIDSEFNDSAGDISFRASQLLAFASKKATPFSRFSCGNSVTLSDIPDLQEYVSHFFNTHYVAGNMCAVLYSSESLDHLQQLALLRFMDIPTSRLVPNMYKVPKRFAGDSFELPLVVVNDENESVLRLGEDGAILGCVLVTDPGFGYHNSLHFTWMLPSQRANFASKPLWYLANLVEDERQGGILHRTRQLGLATDIYCSRDLTFSASQLSHNSAFALWEITMVLTEQGLLQWRQVGAMLFEYLGMLRQAGPSAPLFEELQRCMVANFVFDHNFDLSDMIESYAQRLSPVSGIPPAHVVNGDALLLTYAPDLITQLLNMLTPENACVELRTNMSGLRFNVPPHRNLRAKVFSALKGKRLVEPHYGSPFEICRTPRDCVAAWKQSMLRGMSRSSSSPTPFCLPSRNDYVQSGFVLSPRSALVEGKEFLGCEIEIDSRRGAVACVCAAGEAEFALVVFTSDQSNERRWMKLGGPGASRLNNKTFKVLSPGVGAVRQSELSPFSAPAIISGGTMVGAGGGPASAAGPAPAGGGDSEDNGSLFTFWHLQGGLFSSVRVELCLSVKFPRSLVRRPLNAAMADLMLHVYANTIIKETYPAMIAGTSLTLNLVGNQFRFTYSGFVDTVALLVDRTLPLFFAMAQQGLKHLPNLGSISSHIESLKTQYSNRDQVFSKTLDEILCLDEHDVATKLKALQSVGSRNLAAFAKKAIKAAAVTGFVYGNVDLMAARRLESSIRSMIRANKIEPAGSLGQRRIMKVRTVVSSPQIAGPCAAYIGNGPSSSVLVYFQVMDVPQSRLLCQLVSQVLNNPIVHRFREELSLAYHVSTWFSEIDSISGITIEVSSHHVGSLELLDSIDEFLLTFNERLKKITPAEFTQHITTLALQKLQKDASPADEAQRHFASINNFDIEGAYLWNREAKEAEALIVQQVVSLNDMVAFFNQHIAPVEGSLRRKLNILVLGEIEVKHGALDVVRASILEYYRQQGQDDGELNHFTECMPWLKSSVGSSAEVLRKKTSAAVDM